MLLPVFSKHFHAKFARLGIRKFSSKDHSAILTEFKSCGIITLNRPKRLNSLDLHMIRRIYPKLKEWNENPAISHIIIEGVGNRAFCAGGDVRAVVEAAKVGDQVSELFFREEYRLNHLIGILQKPYIALLDGITMGGGVGLSVHGRFRVATENTLFAMPETAIGLFPDVGGGFFLPRLSCPGLGCFLALTGHRLQGSEVLWAGVATHYKPSVEIEALKEALINLEFPPVTNKAGMIMIDEAISKILDTSNVKPEVPKSLSAHLNTIASTFTLFKGNEPITVEDIMDRLLACARDNGDSHVWAENCLETLKKMSPTSLKVTLRQLQNGSALSFADNFKMEFRLSQRFAAGHDFPEGVRAVLVDKDNKPKWKPDSLDQVTPEMVDRYFAPLTTTPEWEP